MKLLSNKVAGAIEYVGEPVAVTANDPATVRLKSALAALVNSGAAKVRPDWFHAWEKRSVWAAIGPVV